MIQNQKGSLTIDFIFALVLVLSMTLLLGVFSFSLSVVEGIQYLAFSSSRAYFAGNVSLEEQKKMGQQKFDTLSKDGAYKSFLKKEWFSVTPIGFEDFAKTYEKEDSRDIFEGVRLKIVIGLLDLNLPIFGSTTKDGSYSTYINSFIGREPSSEECMGVVANRMNAILKLSNASYSNVGSTAKKAYASFDDNGC